MMASSAELFIKYLGFGQRCSSCGKVRETTRYRLRSCRKADNGEPIQEFRLCDGCQDKGYAIKFEMRLPQADQRRDRARRIRVSRKLERGVAADIGGHVTPGSGNRDTKADIRKVDEWRIEHKYTDGTAGYRLEVKDLAAVIRHANMSGEWPALVINFRKLARQFVVIPYELFLEIVEKIRG